MRADGATSRVCCRLTIGLAFLVLLAALLGSCITRVVDGATGPNVGHACWPWVPVGFSCRATRSGRARS